MRHKFIDNLERGTPRIFRMAFQVVSGDCVLGAALPNLTQMLIHSNGKVANGSAHVLQLAGTCNQVHYIASETCSKMLHLIRAVGYSGNKSIRPPSAQNIDNAWVALPTGMVTFSFWKKYNFFWWIYDIGCNFTLYGFCSPENYTCPFR